MKTHFPLAALMLVFVHYSIAQKKDWTPLFNGQNLDGWIVKCTSEDQDKNYWTVKEGYIEVNSLGDPEHDYVWLMTDKEYGDFELKLKFAAFKSSPGNSGVQIRSRYDDEEGWMDGPQIDIHPQGPWRSGMMWDETRDVKRWIYPDIPKREWVNESMRDEMAEMYYSDDGMQWNDLEIRVKGWTITAYLNGIQITDFNNKKLLTGPGHKKYRVGKQGHIALQLHIGDELRMLFKDIEIREL